MFPRLGTNTEDIQPDIGDLIRLGTVLSIDLAAARCIVQYGDPDDEDPAETPPIRWLAGRAGLTRTWSPPSKGEQVLLLSPDGQFANAIALTGIVQNAFPPVGSTSTEIIEFSDGARLSYDPEAGALRAVLPAGATAKIDAPGGITLRGDVAIEGKVTVSETLTAQQNVIAEGVSLKDHVHGKVQAGSAWTDKPE
ncbi:MAG: phage baseplate assembly protein V [Erythrobacter sp.]|nr:phage baseplate assembly protein V [Erythrobacter sp.]